MLTLIIGGARSGKTRYAQSLCSKTPRVVLIATAKPEDEEMLARIERHRRSRPSHWKTVEEPLAIADAIRSASLEADAILVDCLTVWLSNLCWKLRDRPPEEMEKAACAEICGIAAASREREVVLVSNEVGGGIVPDHPLGRLFRDLQGVVNQRAAAAADRVFLTVAGLPLRIKPSPGEVPW